MATESKRDERLAADLRIDAEFVKDNYGLPGTYERMRRTADAIEAAQKTLTRVKKLSLHYALYGGMDTEELAIELRKALAEPSEQAACGTEYQVEGSDLFAKCSRPPHDSDESALRNLHLNSDTTQWYPKSAAPAATTGDLNNRLLRLEGIVKAIIEAVGGAI